MSIFEAYYHELIGYFSSKLRDRDRAQEVVHECYSRALAASAKMPVREPRAFLYRTAKNILIDEQRRERHRNAGLTKAQLAQDDGESSEERMVAQERVWKLQEAIDSLPPRCREAFTLFKFEGYTQVEIAEKMGISVNMVEKHVIKAMQVCRQCLKEYEE